MNSKEYKTELSRIVEETRAETKRLENEIAVARASLANPKYSNEYRNETIQPQISKLTYQLRDLKQAAVSSIDKLSGEYADTLAVEMNTLKADELTDEIKLLNCGVKLTDRELETLFDRNAGNKTMQKIVTRYADEHNITIKRSVDNTEYSESTRLLKSVGQMYARAFDNPRDDRFYNEIGAAVDALTEE